MSEYTYAARLAELMYRREVDAYADGRKAGVAATEAKYAALVAAIEEADPVREPRHRVSLLLNSWTRIADAYRTVATITPKPKQTPKPYEADPAFDEEYANMEDRRD